MLKNFSAPRSEPKPASVTKYSESFRPILVDIRLEVPWAMLAKGPPWTKAGQPSMVWTRLGLRASLSIRAIAPTALRSFAVTGSPFMLKATIILDSLSLRSSMSLVRHKMAMTSLAAVIEKWSS